MKKLLIVILLFGLLISANSFVLAAPEVVIKFGHVSAVDRDTALGVDLFKDIVESRSDGRIEVQIYPNTQLGSDRDLLEGIRLGTVQMMGAGTSVFSTLTDNFLVLDLPFLAPSREAMYRMFDGEIGQELFSGLSDKGVKALDYWESGMRQLFNNVRTIQSPDDLKGIKLRTMENPVHLATFRNWTALPTPMAWGEVFPAIQTGVVDGFESPLSVFYTQGFYDICKYVTVANQFYLPWLIVAGQKWWDGLDSEDQNLIQDASRIAGQWQRAEAARADGEYLKMLQDMDKVAVNILTDEQRAKFAETSQPVYKQFAEKIGRERFHKILEELNHKLKDVF